MQLFDSVHEKILRRSPQAIQIRQRARAYVNRLLEHIRDRVFRELFLKRRVVAEIFVDFRSPSRNPERSLLS